MKIYGIEINIILLITLGLLFIITFSLTIAIVQNRKNYFLQSDQFKEKIDKINDAIGEILEENNRYKEENYLTNQRISDLEDEYERKYKELEQVIEDECKIELEKQKHKNQKDMEEFSNSQEIWEYFADLFVKKIEEGNNKS